MILSKPFAIACSLALLNVSAADETISLRVGFIEFGNFAKRGEDGKWTGFLFDLADVLVDRAAADGVTLDIDIDTENGVLSDNASFTYNDALTALAPDCAGDLCFDMILGDYYHTSERSQIVTFPQPYGTGFITTFKLTDIGPYNSIKEANEGGGSVCIKPGTAVFDSLSSITTNVIECTGDEDCVGKLKTGECDLNTQDILSGVGDDPAISATGEVLLDIFWLTNALKSSLEPKVLQGMNKWHYDARVSGDIAALQEKWYGYTFDNFAEAFPETMSVSAGVIEFSPFVEISMGYMEMAEDGSIKGIVADVIEAVRVQAEADGVALTIDADTANPLNDDYTYNSALETLSPSCTEESCYDMILADYFHLSERSVVATFLPSFLSTSLTSWKTQDGMFSSFADANAGNGSTCLWAGTATELTFRSEAANTVDCSGIDDCLAKLVAGECDLYIEDIRVTGLAIQGTSVVSTGEVLGDTIFFAHPMASNLEPNVMVLLGKWYLDAAASGQFGEIEASYFGDAGGVGGDSEDGTSSASRFGYWVSAAIVALVPLLNM